MIKIIMFSVIFSLKSNNSCCEGGDVYHQNSKITFYPDLPSSYFGYAVVLSDSSLLVGAPKAKSRLKDSIAPGQVFTCQLGNLETTNVTCYPLGMDDSEHDKSIRRVMNVKDFFRNDMWFGATIATFPEGKFMVCAPRWADPYRDKHLLANGACYVETRRRGMTLTPLKEQLRLAFQTDGSRKEYGEYGTHLNFYAYGQAGMSIKATENNSIIIGAPGLMQWTGGIIDYKYLAEPNSVFFSKQKITNPYFTMELGPDDYFGYSVESGTFEWQGIVLYVAGAPRSKMGFGQVLIFEPARKENDPLNIMAKLRGPQLGSYFGATLCVTDLDNDGKADLLVGAPNYVNKNDDMPFDQGAVFVYLSSNKTSRLELKPLGLVSGDKVDGARFGTSIAALGDYDGDGFNDVAIGAPWEIGGKGAVYIYRGSNEGLKPKYDQKIIAEDSQGFGMSVAKAVDVDANNCTDLAIGAFASGTAYLYRCVPTLFIHTYIKVPDAMNLPKNVTSFTALFCIQVLPSKKILPANINIDLKAKISIDPEENRASTDKDTYKVTIGPGRSYCDEQTIEVKPTADLSKPISLKLDVEPMEPLFDDSPIFHTNAARISEDSKMNASFLIQLIRDCGNDLICIPELVLDLRAKDSNYTPGTSDKLGVIINVLNEEEPAYGAKVHIQLPLPPKRVPGECSLEGLNMTCIVPAPLERDESIGWDIELEHTVNTIEPEILTIQAEVKHPLFIRNENQKMVRNVTITVIPRAEFRITGKTLPNTTMAVSREKFYENENITFIHYFEITNLGPSDWPLLQGSFFLPDNVTITNQIKGCDIYIEDAIIRCKWALSTKASIPVSLSYKYDLGRNGKYLEEQNSLNLTSTITLATDKVANLSLTTTLVLDPAAPIWPHIVGSIAGLLLLAVIVFCLYKYGFFSRTQHDKLKKLQKESSPSENPGSSTSPASEADGSSLELLTDDSD